MSEGYPVDTIKNLVDTSYKISKEHGWHEKERPIPEALCLIHSEVSEALESYRNKEPIFSIVDGKPEGLGSELADVVIRVADMCGELGIDLQKIIEIKTQYNIKRPYRHGGKKC